MKHLIWQVPLGVWMVGTSFNLGMWFTASKESITRKTADNKLYLLYTDGDAEKGVFVSESFYRQHQVGDKIRINLWPAPVGARMEIMCVDWGCTP